MQIDNSQENETKQIQRTKISPIDAPELTILSALDHILELVGFSLVAANSERPTLWTARIDDHRQPRSSDAVRRVP